MVDQGRGRTLQKGQPGSRPDKRYLLILSRKPHMEKRLLEQLSAKAKSAGFDTDKLIFVKQEH